MSERNNILARIREALAVPAPLPVADNHSAGSHPAGESPARHARNWLPSVAGDIEQQFALFAKNAADLKAEFQLLHRREELPAALAKIAAAEQWHRIASHDDDWVNFARSSLRLPLLLTDRGYDPQELEKCDAAITGCDALVAQTGGVVVTSRSAGGRALSILPPHHVVVARRGQLVADLPAAFALLQQQYTPDFPSMISFITGPSRTGDIERILVLGAHGPKKLTILCV